MRFSETLIVWYKQHQRDLPWRDTTDPYKIWLSEIILQQTRVNQGLNYYHKFLKKHPTIQSLAESSEKNILNLWQGLGYYSRARNLHFTAKYISAELNGIFPTKHQDILKLKGIGEYTAAAIASFAYKESYPVIDGNVYRVLSRIFGVENAIDSTTGKKIFKKLAAELIDPKNPDTYNQAIMEFGALQCKPKSPNCEDCPFLLECFAYKNKLVSVLPKKEKKIKQRIRFFNYLVIINENTIYLNERKEKDIWQGLYDFPVLETEQELTSYPLLEKEFTTLELSLKDQSIAYKHILSHQKIYATFWLVSSNKPANIDVKFNRISLNKINKYPVPKLIENYLKTVL
jgi:A/G-specific adenine glycosylase